MESLENQGIPGECGDEFSKQRERDTSPPCNCDSLSSFLDPKKKILKLHNLKLESTNSVAHPEMWQRNLKSDIQG